MKALAAQRLDRLLERREALERLEYSTALFASRLRGLRRWQAARLARTYADLRGDARFAAATGFFLSDLYGAHDIGARDRQFLRAWRLLRRWLPPEALRVLGRALDLDILTRELDQAMAAQLPGSITATDYAQAYRTVGQRDSRQRQIELVVAAGSELEHAVHLRGIGLLLKTAHAPAHALGLGLLQDFLERGFEAFGHLSAADEFLATIHARETTLMETLFAGGTA